MTTISDPDRSRRVQMGHPQHVKYFILLALARLQANHCRTESRLSKKPRRKRRYAIAPYRAEQAIQRDQQQRHMRDIFSEGRQ